MTFPHDFRSALRMPHSNHVEMDVMSVGEGPLSKKVPPVIVR